jgi:5'-methylthioadenosine phosphorylase
MSAPIGILGGSGLYAMPGVEAARSETVTTPFGAPSDPLIHGLLDGAPVVFLSRHGQGHRFTPSEVNYRANLWALKAAGCRLVLSVSAVGSLQERHEPGTLRLPDQFIDRSHLRASTFFGQGLVAHVSYADPTSAWLRGRLMAVGRRLGLPLENGGTYVNMEGPQFSTRAESLLHRSWGADLIGMTQATEAKLAREAEMAFATIALVTDWDAWREGEEGTHGDAVMEVMAANVQKAQALIRAAVPELAAGIPEDEPALGALATALVTAPELVPPETRERLRLLIGKYGY